MPLSKITAIQIAFIFVLSSCGGGGGGDGGSGSSNAGQNNSGNITGSSAQLVANQTYVVNAGSTRAMLQLPASASLKIGDSVTVSGQSAGGWEFAQAADQSILTTAVADNDLSGTAGNTWSSHLTNQNWFAVASSSDGMHLVAAADEDFVYASEDSGNTWTVVETTSAYEWRKVLVSADGKRLFALSVYDGIYRSDDSGKTWQIISNAIPSTHWSLDASADGNVLVVSNWPDNQSSSSGYYASSLEISADAGKTWTECKPTLCAFARYVAVSANGQIIMGTTSTGNVFRSTDQGNTWATVYSGGG